MVVTRVEMDRMAWLVVGPRLIVTDVKLDILASGCEKPVVKI